MHMDNMISMCRELKANQSVDFINNELRNSKNDDCLSIKVSDNT